jgi:hypothetical protein
LADLVVLAPGARQTAHFLPKNSRSLNKTNLENPGLSRGADCAAPLAMSNLSFSMFLRNSSCQI